MKRILLGVGMLALTAAPALADANANLDRTADQLVDQDVSSGSTATVNRWGFGLAGPDKVRAAADRCPGRPVAAVSQHHTGTDVATAFFTLGIYTPTHISYSCQPSTANR